MATRSRAERRYELVVIVLALLVVAVRLAQWRDGWPDLNPIAIVSLLLVPIAVRTQITISRGPVALTLGGSVAALFASDLSDPQSTLPIWAVLVAASYALFHRDETYGQFRAAIQVLGADALLRVGAALDLGLQPYESVVAGLLAYFIAITALETVRRLFVPADGRHHVMLTLRWARLLLVGTGIFFAGAALAVLRRVYAGDSLPVYTSFAAALVGTVAVSLGLAMRLRQLSRSVAALAAAGVTMPWPGDGIEDVLREHSLAGVRSDDVQIRDTPGERWDVSVLLGDGRFLVASRTRGDLPISEIERHVLEALANMATASQAAADQLGQLLERATTDSLTGLSTYSHFRDCLEEVSASRRPEESLAIVFIDLDAFKEVNDRYGHLVGDAAIREIASRLLEATGPDPLVTRFGGDEFALLVRDVRDFTHLQAVIDRIRDVVADPITVGTHTLRLHASVGAALSSRADDSVDGLVRTADEQMYHHKRAIHADDGDVTLRIDHAVRAAIRERRLAAAYQPIVRLDSGTMRALEVLVRCDDPELGAIPPPVIVESAQRLNLLDDLTALLLEDAVETMIACRRIAPELHYVTINVEIEQIATWTALLDVFVASRLEHDVPIVLEISERSIGRWTEAHTGVARRLQEAGVLLAIDDFGAGYASLGSLHRVPADCVKLDRSLLLGLSSPWQATILRRTTELLAELGVVVVAEGIEDASAAAAVKEFGATHGQGFWLGTDMSREELLGRLREPDADVIRSSS